MLDSNEVHLSLARPTTLALRHCPPKPSTAFSLGTFLGLLHDTVGNPLARSSTSRRASAFVVCARRHGWSSFFANLARGDYPLPFCARRSVSRSERIGHLAALCGIIGSTSPQWGQRLVRVFCATCLRSISSCGPRCSGVFEYSLLQPHREPLGASACSPQPLCSPPRGPEYLFTNLYRSSQPVALHLKPIQLNCEEYVPTRSPASDSAAGLLHHAGRRRRNVRTDLF